MQIHEHWERAISYCERCVPDVTQGLSATVFLYLHFVLPKRFPAVEPFLGRTCKTCVG